MTYQEILIFIIEILGTVAFAASGAMVGVDRKMDVFGVSVLGVITAVGGGMTRDIILGLTPPSVFRNPIYAIVATITSCVVFAVVYYRKELLKGSFRVTYDRIMLVLDSVGLGLFTVMGVSTGFRYGFGNNGFLLAFLGTITGVGGGLLRDVMAGVPPYIFVRHIYACASIVGAVTCVFTYKAWGEVPSMVVSAGVVILIRYLAAHYHWNLPNFYYQNQREKEK